MTDTRRAEFVEALNAHVAAIESRREFRQQRIRDTRDELLRLFDAATAVQGGEPVPEVARTAPERIWLQISDDEDDAAEPFPYGSEVTWCQDSVSACEVEYVRADLAAPPAARQDEGRDAAIQYAEAPDEIVIDEDDAKALHNLADFTDFRIRLASLGVRVR